MRVALFVPCFMDVFAPRAAMAAARVLRRLGHEVAYPEGQTCCGQPALNAGRFADAACLARRLLEVLAAGEPEAVVSPSGSCVAALRVEGPRQTGLSHRILSRLFEFSEFLTGVLGVTDVGASFPGTVAWHDGCHALRTLGVRDGPRRLLAAVRGLTLRELPAPAECCGFGGVFAVKYAGTSAGIAARKADAVAATGASYVASTESSCLLQIEGVLRRRGSRVRALHLAEILAGGGA